ncbi:uncharacterized protein EV154DRAFT_495395 [Mucor mucedo]|uniref:uncharacterized protein n=1 Tax=Mucor mucedo TaxID=29922 RepID=UPI0022200DBA|nr:uncharacterized protein EV154DRAFT_495395 [Mucor mucedo]KAI7895592.1 hypothetical protein EV154DRAFT_495395 [Mucor mucedo]
MLSVTEIIPSDNIHAEETRANLKRLKELTEGLEGWEETDDQSGVKLYHQPDASIPLVRGDTLLLTKDLPPGCTPLAVATVATLPGCRRIWDEKFDESKVLEYYSRYESLFWVKLKAPWPISPRDFAGTSIRDVGENTVYCSMVSVEDETIPDTSGAVRGQLLVSGWKLSQLAGGIGITYVNQVDLAGYIPGAFLKKLLLQIPLCAGKVRDYIMTHGFVPTTTVIQNNTPVEFKGEEFHHEEKKYTLQLSSQDASTHTVCSQRMYPDGIQVELKGEAEITQSVDTHGNALVHLSHIKGLIQLCITKK